MKMAISGKDIESIEILDPQGISIPQFGLTSDTVYHLIWIDADGSEKLSECTINIVIREGGILSVDRLDERIRESGWIKGE